MTRSVRAIPLVATLLAAFGVAACNMQNPNFCCVTAEQCAELGLAEVRPCADSTRPFCDWDGTYPASDGIKRGCIPDPLSADCEGPQDCTTAERPFCIDGACRECEDGGDCAATAPACDPDTHLCGICTIDDDCLDQAGLPRCFVDEGACVACIEAADCTAATAPICDDADHTCRACGADSECTSDACNTVTGACLDEADVIYLAPGGSAGTCTQATPCATFAQGLTQVGGTRNVIKVGPGTYSEATVTLSGLTVTILGAGAILEPLSINQPVVFVTSGADVTIDGLRIRSAGGTGVGVRCDPGAGASPTLRLQGATVSGNSGGGVSISSCSFTLTNNWIIGNGNPTTSTLGGVAIANISGAGTRRMDFNTIFDNTSAGTDPGVTCSSVIVALSFGSNIIYGNEAASQAGGTMCAFTYSDIGPTASAGTGNINMAPLFVDSGNGDYHLMATSPGVDVADAAATEPVDIDRDPRPQGTGRDMGADEVVP